MYNYYFYNSKTKSLVACVDGVCVDIRESIKSYWGEGSIYGTLQVQGETLGTFGTIHHMICG